MDSLLSFIAKFIGAPASVGATVALSAFIIYALRRAGIEPFAALDGPTYLISMSVGVIGFCGAVVIGFWNGVVGMGEAATAVRGASSAEAPQARSHEKP